MSRATLTLIDGQLDGPDGMQMEVDFHGDIDPTSVAHNVIDHFRQQLIDNAAHAQAAAEEAAKPKLRLLLPVGVANV